jgi:hypothetical protein
MLGSTKKCQLKFESQELELSILTLQTKYPHNNTRLNLCLLAIKFWPSYQVSY